jgi:uncharacterized protein YecT (DUF1311 family)
MRLATLTCAGVGLILLSVLPAWPQSPDERSRCLSIANVDQRVDCLENMGRSAQASPSPSEPAPPQENRALDCRNPQDAVPCRNAERDYEIHGGRPLPPKDAYRPPDAQAPPQYGMPKPSFDCATAKTRAARLICADAELTRLDGRLEAAFRTRKAQMSALDQSKFVTGQLAWIRDRNKHCGLNGKSDATIEALAISKPCLVKAIRERIAFLAQAATSALRFDTNPSSFPSSGDLTPQVLVDAQRKIHGAGTHTASATMQEQQNEQPANDRLAVLLKACDDKAARARTVGAPTRPDGFMALNPGSAATAYQDWQVALRQHLYDVEYDRLRCRKQAPLVLAAQQATAQHLKMEEQRGYKRITYDDFKLDGKQLAANESKIAITGFYLKIGEGEYLFPSILAVAMMRQTLSADNGIGLLTNDAKRNIRKYFLDCQNNPAMAQIGCRINVLGHVTICTKTSLLSGSTELPCLVVEDGW